MMKISSVAGTFLSLVTLSHACGDKENINSKDMQERIDTDVLMSHLECLDRIANTTGGNRAFGHPGYDASVDYIWNQIKDIEGSHAWKQEFEAWFGEVQSISLEVDGKDMYVIGPVYSPSTSEEGIEAELVLQPNNACDSSSYVGLEGKIILLAELQCKSGGNSLNAAKQGGAGAVILISGDERQPTVASVGDAEQRDGWTPIGIVSMEDGKELSESLQEGKNLTAKFQQTQLVEKRKSQNIIVEMEDGDAENVVMFGAHLDSVDVGAGINDNGSGSVLLLEVFKAAMRYGVRNKLRFAWWGAEESGLLGSQEYVQRLEVHDANAILAYLNFDMVGRGYVGVMDTGGKFSNVSGPPGSDAIQDMWIDYFKDECIESVPVPMNDASDHKPFWDLGKPFGLLNSGVEIEQDPFYHTAGDNIHNIDTTILTAHVKAVAHAAAVLGMKGHEMIPKVLIDEPSLNKTKRSLPGQFGKTHHARHAAGLGHGAGCSHRTFLV